MIKLPPDPFTAEQLLVLNELDPTLARSPHFHKPLRAKLEAAGWNRKRIRGKWSWTKGAVTPPVELTKALELLEGL